MEKKFDFALCKKSTKNMFQTQKYPPHSPCHFVPKEKVDIKNLWHVSRWVGGNGTFNNRLPLGSKDFWCSDQKKSSSKHLEMRKLSEMSPTIIWDFWIVFHLVIMEENEKKSFLLIRVKWEKRGKLCLWPYNPPSIRKGFQSFSTPYSSWDFEAILCKRFRPRHQE